MRRLWFLVLLLAAVTLTLKAGDFPPQQELRQQQTHGNSAATKAVGDLYFVAIGQQDNWKFLPEGFARAVRDQAKALYCEIHGSVLVGTTATKKRLLDGVDWMCANAKADDLVMLFIACHGTCTRGGESVFATRTGPVRPREIKSRLAKLPCQAIVVNDACQSGNCPKEFDGDPMPPNVTARIAIEQASTFGWERYVGARGRIIGMKTFGASAPLRELQRKFGFEPDHVVATARELLGRA